MPIEDGHAVHYLAVARGTPVYGSDEQLVGSQREVDAAQQKVEQR